MLDMTTKKLETLLLHIIRINKNLHIIIYSKLLYSPKILHVIMLFIPYLLHQKMLL